MNDSTHPIVTGWDGLQRRMERTIPFVCLGSDCPKSCCGPFCGTGALTALLTASDLGEIIRSPFEHEEEDRAGEISIFAQIRLTETDVARLQNAGLDYMIVRRRSGAQLAYYLRLHEDGSCTALSPGNYCTIHAARPTLCRAFPFYIDLFAGLSMVTACPGIGAGKCTIDDINDEVEAAVEMYDFWVKSIQGALQDRAKR
ncbi:MAG: YkgJ family cysteine cluster protein [Armatimonadota bacterium]